MRNKIFLIGLAIFASACTSAPPTWVGRGSASIVTPASEDPEINIQEGLNAHDYRALISTALKSLAKCNRASKNLPHMVSTFSNETSSDLDLALLKRELNDILHENGYAVVDKTSRPEVAEEYDYESKSGFTNPAQAIQKGRQVGIAFFIRTAINARNQQLEDRKFTRYRLSLQIVNTETNEVTCVGASELRKEYERRRVAL